MIAKPNLTIAKILTESYINSADSTSDLVLFTAEAYEKLNKLKAALYPDMTDAEIAATRRVIDAHLAIELVNRLGIALK